MYENKNHENNTIYYMICHQKCYSDAYMRGPPGHPGPWACVAGKFLISAYPTFYETCFYLDLQQRR